MISHKFRVCKKVEVQVEKKIEKLIYVKNMDGFFNKEKPIEHIVEVNAIVR